MATTLAETEASLIPNAQQGDRKAFGELVRRHHAGVVIVVYRMCGDLLLAEDAAKDAYYCKYSDLSQACCPRNIIA